MKKNITKTLSLAGMLLLGSLKSAAQVNDAVSYTHLTLPTTPYV